MAFGDGERALELLGEIRKGTPLGRILGHGAAMAGRVLGVVRVPVVKGQAMSAYEPRAIKGTGVTYATSPQGADHTAGNTVRAKVDHLDPKVQAALSRAAQISMAGYDTLGACIFAGSGFAVAPEVVPALLNARYGWQVGGDILQKLRQGVPHPGAGVQPARRLHRRRRPPAGVDDPGAAAAQELGVRRGARQTGRSVRLVVRVHLHTTLRRRGPGGVVRQLERGAARGRDPGRPAGQPGARARGRGGAAGGERGHRRTVPASCGPGTRCT